MAQQAASVQKTGRFGATAGSGGGFSLVGLAALCLLAALGAGCVSNLTAANLNRKHWEEGAEQKLQGQYLRFSFTTFTKDEVPCVKGVAWPIKENLPLWADSVDGLTLKAYLCDETGRVLAVATHHYTGQKYPAEGFVFDVQFKKSALPSGGFFVALGYATTFVASKPPAAGGQGSGNISGQYLYTVSEEARLAK